MAGDPLVLAPLRLHYLRWILFNVGSDTCFMYQEYLTPISTSTPKTPSLYLQRLESIQSSKISRVSHWIGKRRPAFVKFVREHQCPSFLEYGEYPFVSADEIKKALNSRRLFQPCSIRCSDLLRSRAWLMVASSMCAPVSASRPTQSHDGRARVRRCLQGRRGGDGRQLRHPRACLTDRRRTSEWGRHLPGMVPERVPVRGRCYRIFYHSLQAVTCRCQ